MSAIFQGNLTGPGSVVGPLQQVAGSKIATNDMQAFFQLTIPAGQSGTFTLQGSFDNGVTWVDLACQRMDTLAQITSYPVAIAAQPDGSAVPLFIPNMAFMNAIQIVCNSLAGAVPIPVQGRSGSFFASLPPSSVLGLGAAFAAFAATPAGSVPPAQTLAGGNYIYDGTNANQEYAEQYGGHAGVVMAVDVRKILTRIERLLTALLLTTDDMAKTGGQYIDANIMQAVDEYQITS